MATPEVSLDIYSKALSILQEDADKIEKLIEVQMETLTNRRCPLYEEVLDTQMYGLSREIDFAVRVGLISAQLGKEILARLQRNLDIMYEALNNKSEEQAGS
jgi:uncharacterized protein YlaN (UPF0358 family)